MQIAIVIAILCATVFFVIRAIVRMPKGKGGCGCGCNNCPISGNECHCTEQEKHSE